jgi:hypothetical protein
VLRSSCDALTPAAREVVCLAGLLSGFAEGGTAALPTLTGLHRGGSTVLRTTGAAGRCVGARRADGEVFGAARDWERHKDAEGKPRAYVALDATGVGQRGPRGARAEGRMATVAMVDNPAPDEKEWRARPDGPAPRFDVR